MRALGYPPHITLAKYDAIDSDLLARTVAELAGIPRLRMTFDRLASFDAGSLILWASPAPHPGLAELHARLHAQIDPLACRPAYRPGRWTPHCTLALRIAPRHREEAARLLASEFAAFALDFDILDCVTSPPIAVLAEHALAA
ncbi:2'-5' RNA ligase family protein [Novosphingobium profundi]|uniref:2'-5' RNA ligase family protein n=1 Tax=Novosphingobium profundi TaxID=1774954 RepID=UPI001BDA191B|nr:2'-5' RNA ligase family protein [Novosphingobium profundi]MBT0669258.1 2'-5' RNA ligase family protein [Novosphingobium profundi]